MPNKNQATKTYFELSPASIAAFIKQLQLPKTVFSGEVEEVIDIGDGNLNNVFRVKSSEGQSIVIKQSLEYLKCVGPEHKLAKERMQFEIAYYNVVGKLAKKFVPEIFYQDPKNMMVLVMEDLNAHQVMRTGVIAATRYPRFAQHMGQFLALSLFYTSRLHLNLEEHEQLAETFKGNNLRQLTEEFVFTFPYMQHKSNYRHDVGFSQQFKSNAAQLRACFQTNAEALIHADLHTGSLMVNETETKVIDTEFAYVGPMAFDLGLLFANLIMAWVAQFELSNQREYQSWLLRTTNQLWLNFEKEFIALWNENLSAEEKAFHGDSLSSYQHAYMQKLFQQTVGFAGLEICRRTVGIAGVTDIRGLEDSAARARAESACLKIGKSLVESCFNLSNSNKLTQQVSEWRLQAYAADKKSTTTKSTTLIGAIGCASVVGLFFAARAGRQTSSMKNAVRYLAKR